MALADVAWVLNLDAEVELAHEGPHTPTAVNEARVHALLPNLAPLIGEKPWVIWPPVDPRPAQRPSRVQAWCPTRFALERIEAAGFARPPAPSVEVLRRANHRRFAFELGTELTAHFVTEEAQGRALVARSPGAVSSEDTWLLKRPFGYAGKARRKIRAGVLSEDDERWLTATFRLGHGVLIEPWVHREADFALHGELSQSGTLRRGTPTIQIVDDTGAWRSSRPVTADELSNGERDRLQQAFERTSTALKEVGYFGPFGIDAYRWRDAKGTTQFQSLSELNARYSMGWATTLG